MQGQYAVVDLFAGPGGLAEGVSSFRTKDQLRPYKIALSIEKEKSILEICYDSGFKNLSNFNRLFKKQFQKNPLEYRRS